VLTTTLDFDLANLGNTPIRLIDVVCEYVTPPGWDVANAKTKTDIGEGWSIQPQIVAGYSGRTIEQKGSIKASATASVRLSDEARTQLIKARMEYGDGALVSTQIHIKATYVDVFRHKHAEIVCVTAATNNTNVPHCNPNELSY